MTHPFAEVLDYAGLHAALRQRCCDLAVTLESLDDLAGLPVRHCSKLLAPVPIKFIGKTSLGPLLGALGLKLLVVEDVEALARVQKRLIRSNSSAGIRPLKKYKRRGVWKNNTAWSVMMNGRRVLLMTPRQRSASARKAIKARWAKRSMGGSSRKVVP